MKNGIFYIFAAAAQAFYKKRSPETINFRAPFPQSVLPYQELLGNYNSINSNSMTSAVLPYQELLGNYNPLRSLPRGRLCFTIPRTARELQREDKTNVDRVRFTIPRTARELQHWLSVADKICSFTIPRTARELQHWKEFCGENTGFTIPRTARELQHLSRSQ